MPSGPSLALYSSPDGTLAGCADGKVFLYRAQTSTRVQLGDFRLDAKERVVVQILPVPRESPDAPLVEYVIAGRKKNSAGAIKLWRTSARGEEEIALPFTSQCGCFLRAHLHTDQDHGETIDLGVGLGTCNARFFRIRVPRDSTEAAVTFLGQIPAGCTFLQVLLWSSDGSTVITHGDLANEGRLKSWPVRALIEEYLCAGPEGGFKAKSKSHTPNPVLDDDLREEYARLCAATVCEHNHDPYKAVAKHDALFCNLFPAEQFDENKYQGQVDSSGIPHGHGSIVEDGSTYVGMWRSGIRNGYGVETTESGDVYKGMWVDNRKEGFGRMNRRADSRTEGDSLMEGFFKKSRHHGMSLWTNAAGEQRLVQHKTDLELQVWSEPRSYTCDCEPAMCWVCMHDDAKAMKRPSLSCPRCRFVAHDLCIKRAAESELCCPFEACQAAPLAQVAFRPDTPPRVVPHASVAKLNPAEQAKKDAHARAAQFLDQAIDERYAAYVAKHMQKLRQELALRKEWKGVIADLTQAADAHQAEADAKQARLEELKRQTLVWMPEPAGLSALSVQTLRDHQQAVEQAFDRWMHAL